MANGDFGIDRSPPSGSIVMWAGLLADIPSGWVICDGNNGTPNLFDRFVKSVPSGIDPGASGGQNSHTISSSQMATHSHTTSSSNSGKHNHSQDYSGSGSWGSSDVDPIRGSNSSWESHGTQNGAHTHSTDIGLTGSGSSVENRPPFYEIAYIMKT